MKKTLIVAMILTAGISSAASAEQFYGGTKVAPLPPAHTPAPPPPGGTRNAASAVPTGMNVITHPSNSTYRAPAPTPQTANKVNCVRIFNPVSQHEETVCPH
jgi:hypothetical protein